MSRFTILGCGYTGTVVAERLRQGGHEVVCTSTNGLDNTISFDVLTDVMGPWADGSHVIYSVPTLFKTVPDNDDHLRPLQSVIDALISKNIVGITYLSATSVYGDHKGAVVTESSATRPTAPYGKMRLALETLLKEANLSNTSSVRIGGIYGPGRTIDGRIRAGTFQMVDGGSKLSNRIHVDDLASIIIAAATMSTDDYRTYLAVDGQPMPVRTMIDWVCERFDLPLPENVSIEAYAALRGENNAARWQTSIRCDNRETLDTLGVTLTYPAVTAGYEAIFG